ncbi:DNA internalization-related competence protein ComEC/Rec2 [Neobacillus novalis]|uniref:DNA internalization-related competence protein ComEC/Rec2 n=1 Tax=Neobacillus novalis TaxID=220687 RepID=A0AA95MJ35_9BACI|nr:DNA internalization-related competence protein ComEC/Rec2 [Neobacillus novalis]WHY84784.1 DNA internalization-related competence protein ComEC/Rec2 [Neobacillus novalis]
MNGKFFYFALTALLGVLCSLVTFLPFFLLTILYLYLLNKYKRFENKQLFVAMIIFVTFLLLAGQTELDNKSVIPETTTDFYIQFTENPKIDGDLLQIQATEKQFKEKLLVRYKIKSEAEQVSLKSKSFYNCSCQVSGTMKKPAIAKNPNGFNYREYLASKDIYWIVEIPAMKQLRFLGIRYLEAHFPIEIASLSAALIFGDRSMLDPVLLGDFQKTGIVHLLAISGLHVSLLVGMVFYLGIRIGLTRQLMMNFLLLILPVYVILTGASPSVIRAVLMIYLVLLTVKWKSKRKLLPIDAISLAFMIFLFFSQKVIFDIGFQLSFSVSLVIIFSAPIILRRFQNNGARILATSVTAQLAALPLLFYHFFEMSMMGIAANMLYIPLFSFVYLPGLYILFIVQILFGNTPLFLLTIFEKIINLSNHLIGYLAHFSFAAFVPGRPNIIQLIIYIVIILAIFYIWEAKVYPKRKTHLIYLVVFLLSFQPVWNWLNPFGEVTMIDVGQGDSSLIHLPHGRGTYLIDTGGTLAFGEEEWKQRSKPYEVGRDVVVPFLKGKGITKIDKLILTHGDMDHIGGTFSILKELRVKQILMPSVVAPSETEIRIIQEAERRKIPVIKVSAGDQWKSAGGYFNILSPEKNFSGERNSGSIVLVAQVGGVTWFFGGDLDQEGEMKISKQYPNLSIDVLKAGHHGSKTSSAEAFIKQIKPSTALISAGETNRYGHPHQEVLDRLKETNTTIYRTDLQGAITFRFFRNNGTFSTYLP